LQRDITENTELPIKHTALKKTLKLKLKMSYRAIKRVSSPGNTVRCRVLRHLYAKAIIPLYENNRHIINIDESWVS